MPATGIFSIADLRANDDPANSWFNDNSQTALAGRCLLDALEYVRADPKFPSRFRQVTNAHALRLLCKCLANERLKSTHALSRLRTRLTEMCRSLLAKRNPEPPHFGDDFWDWASVLDSFVEAEGSLRTAAINKQQLARELNDFLVCVRTHVAGGLTFKNGREWYGPATAAVAYRLLKSQRTLLKIVKKDLDALLNTLRTQALEPIVGGKYRGSPVLPHLILWHSGQVVAEFGRDAAHSAAAHLGSLSALGPVEADVKVYALARLFQAATQAHDSAMKAKVLAELYKCENQARPLGHGLLGDNVKGALNALEAIWEDLKPGDYDKIAEMIDALVLSQAKENTIGIVIAIDREMDAVRKAFKTKSAPVWVDDIITLEIQNKTFKVVACGGKATVDATRATERLVRGHNAKAIIMIGVAGSLGVEDAEGKWKGPDKGHVVISTSCAPFEIRTKMRETTESVGVPYAGEEWETIPADPKLFKAAHTAVGKNERESGRFYEGLIVTGNGIRDSGWSKAEALAKFPGGLAVEEEGYLMAIICMMAGIPSINIRGISDRAEGDKARAKLTDAEKKDQEAAASAAAGLAFKIVKKIASEW